MSPARFLRVRVVRDAVVSASHGVTTSHGRVVSGTGPAHADDVTRRTAPRITTSLDRAVFAGPMPTAAARLVVEGFARLWLPADGPTVWSGEPTAGPLFGEVADALGVGTAHHLSGDAAVAVGELLVADPAFSARAMHPVLVDRLGIVRWTGDGDSRVWLARHDGDDSELVQTLRSTGWTVATPSSGDLASLLDIVAGARRLAGRPAALLQVAPLLRGLGASVEPVSDDAHPVFDVVAAAHGWRVSPRTERISHIDRVVAALSD